MSSPLAVRQERKLRTRQAIVDAALELLVDRSFDGLSLREVAKRAGIVPTAFYRHFDSMEELGVALVRESMRSLREMLRSVRRDREGSSGTIAESVETLLAHLRGQPAHFRFLIRERYSGTGAVASTIGTELRLFTSELAVDLARRDELRGASSEQLRLVADLMVTLMIATVMTWLDRCGGAAYESDMEAEPEIAEEACHKLRLITMGAIRMYPPQTA